MLENCPIEYLTDTGALARIDTSSPPPFIKPLMDEATHCKRIGMVARLQAIEKEVGLRLLADFLERQDGRLVEVEFEVEQKQPFCYWLVGKKLPTNTLRQLTFINRKGERKTRTRFEMISLADFADEIPPEILEKIPDDAGNKSVVFKEQSRPDPYLAVPLKGKYFAVFHQWGQEQTGPATTSEIFRGLGMASANYQEHLRQQIYMQTLQDARG